MWWRWQFTWNAECPMPFIVLPLRLIDSFLLFFVCHSLDMWHIDMQVHVCLCTASGCQGLVELIRKTS